MFTQNQQQILALLINNPRKDFYLSEIGLFLGKHPGVFLRGINALEQQGIVKSQRRGNQRLFHINCGYPFFREIKGIVQKTAGVEGLLKDLVSSMDAIQTALIYGSYAQGKMHTESDIDLLLVVKSFSAEEHFLKKLDPLERKLQREINYKIYTREEFANKRRGGDPFLEEVLNRLYILIKGKL